MVVPRATGPTGQPLQMTLYLKKVRSTPHRGQPAGRLHEEPPHSSAHLVHFPLYVPARLCNEPRGNLPEDVGVFFFIRQSAKHMGKTTPLHKQRMRGCDGSNFARGVTDFSLGRGNFVLYPHLIATLGRILRIRLYNDGSFVRAFGLFRFKAALELMRSVWYDRDGAAFPIRTKARALWMNAINHKREDAGICHRECDGSG